MFKQLLFLLILVSSACFADEVSIQQVPSWVTTKQVNLEAEIPQDEVKSGRYYLLVDKQTLVTENNDTARFRHYATQAITPEGVETESQLNIDYDPNYQVFTLHNITIWRDGKAIDKTLSSQKKLLQQEKNLENLIYDGDTTVNILLSDVRVGDIIDYSYSIHGSNPVFSGSFSLAHSLNWSVPLEQSYIRVLWQKQKKLHHKVYNSSLKLTESILPNGVEYIIQKKNVEALSVEDNIPNWIEPYAYIRFSEVNSWKEVIDWGISLFSKQQSVDITLKQTLKNIISNETSKAKQIALILNYVQTEVRYLGIEFGENSHRPSPATETLNRLYGDCKDKVVLFNTFLKEIGVNTYPALVNTEVGNDLINQMPRYAAFDHVISAVEFNGKTYWLDPTRLNQTKNIENIHQPDFGYALLLKDTDIGLTKIEPKQKNSKVVVEETFRLFNEPNLTANYKVSTVYYHNEAEKMRREQISSSKSEIRKDYTKYYQDYYSSLKEASKATFKDNREANEFHVEEQYLIKSFWYENEKKQRLYGNFYANLISPFLTLPKDLRREYPIKISHPIIREQVTKIYFEDDNWDFEDEKSNHSTPFFNYSESTEFSKKERLLTLTYNYESNVELVEPEDFNNYILALKELKDSTEFGIYINMKKATSSVSEEETDGAEDSNVELFYWLFGGYILLFIITILLWRLDSTRNKYHNEALYYPIKPLKFIILWVATFGIYAMYWNYKNWQYIKYRDSLHIMPFARGFFYNFWYYPLYKTLVNENQNLAAKGNLPKKWIAVTIAILFICIALIGQYLELDILGIILTSLLTLPLLTFINFINSNNPKRIEHNSKWMLRHSLILILSLPLLIFTFGSEIGVLPSESVVSGDVLSKNEMKVLQRKNIIEPGEEIIYFYSDDLLSNLDDGNGFTENNVFSYWLEDNVFNFEKASFYEVSDIEVTWANNQLIDNTIVKIVLSDESSFLLYVSSTDKKDRLFVNKLKELWRKKQASITHN